MLLQNAAVKPANAVDASPWKHTQMNPRIACRFRCPKFDPFAAIGLTSECSKDHDAYFAV
jgi:hypothetical protein